MCKTIYEILDQIFRFIRIYDLCEKTPTNSHQTVILQVKLQSLPLCKIPVIIIQYV